MAKRQRQQVKGPSKRKGADTAGLPGSRGTAKGTADRNRRVKKAAPRKTGR